MNTLYIVLYTYYRKKNHIRKIALGLLNPFVQTCSLEVFVRLPGLSTLLNGGWIVHQTYHLHRLPCKDEWS